MKYKNWVLIIVVNLFIVALLGLLMRYKIAFSLPLLEQKHIQHAHSHFAFTAWISQALYLMLIHFLESNTSIDTKKYNGILWVNTFLSIGMMISFILKGYHISSNTFSFSIIITSLFFTFHFIKDSKKFEAHKSIKKWFYAGLLFNILSTFGTFYLAYMMINKVFHQETQLASVYFYLHFQYNGWFIFTCLGMMFYQLNKSITIRNQGRLFWMFFISTFPNYFLSILWLKIPIALYALVIVTAFVQLLVWLNILFEIYRNRSFFKVIKDQYFKSILIVLFLSFTIKLTLQLFSTIPSISHLAYSLRPIVIAYLHLVLLVIISLFILQYFTKYILKVNTPLALFIFMICILANELLLGIQGFAGIFTISIPNIHYYLFGVSVFILASVLYTLRSIRSL